MVGLVGGPDVVYRDLGGVVEDTPKPQTARLGGGTHQIPIDRVLVPRGGPLSTSLSTLSGAEVGARQQQGAARRFHAMVKPIGATCNLNCAYCYYLSKEMLLDQQAGKRISDTLLEEFIRQYIEGQDGEQIVFSWQGGEPTLLGLEFFHKVVELQRKHKPAHRRIENDLQTNGTLLNEEWCRFLWRHNFLVGLSIDGPRDLHDEYRVTKGGEPTFGKVLAAARLMKKHGVRFNTLTVVNRLNVKRPLDVYRFLTREVGSKYVQFIPCVEPKDFQTTAPQHWAPSKLPIVGTIPARPGLPYSVVTDWSVDPEDWGEFLCKCFDDWLARDLGRVLVNLFETAVAQTLGLPSQICIYHDFCGKGMAVESDGSVFACDHYVYPEYRVGRIQEGMLWEMAFSKRQMEFGLAKREKLPRYCKQCPHLDLCWGECPKNRLVRAPDGEVGLNYLCPGLRRFFAYAKPHLRQIADRIRRQRV